MKQAEPVKVALSSSRFSRNCLRRSFLASSSLAFCSGVISSSMPLCAAVAIEGRLGGAAIFLGMKTPSGGLVTFRGSKWTSVSSAVLRFAGLIGLSFSVGAIWGGLRWYCALSCATRPVRLLMIWCDVGVLLPPVLPLKYKGCLFLPFSGRLCSLPPFVGVARLFSHPTRGFVPTSRGSGGA